MTTEIYNIWGHRFQWTPRHIPPNKLRPMRYTYDELGAECFRKLSQIQPSHEKDPKIDSPLSAHQTRRDPSSGHIPKCDFYSLLKDNYIQDQRLHELWTEVNRAPDWVNWDQIERGQKVFYRYGLLSMNALAFQGLLGRGAETLVRTSGLGRQSARRRVFETSQFVLEVTRCLAALRPGGEGQISCIRVRFLHALVRHRFMALMEKHPTRYSIEEYGIPINDLDAIATILDLSAVMLLLGLPRQGIRVREQENADCIAVWRLVAHYLGTPTEPFRTVDSARIMLESYLVSEMHVTENSRILAQNIFSSFEHTLSPYIPRSLLLANTRWLNGSQLADQLGFETLSRWWPWFMLSGLYPVLASFAYICRSNTWLDEGQIEIQRRLMWAVVVEGKSGLNGRSFFEYTNEPRLDPPQDLETENTRQDYPSMWSSRALYFILALGLLCISAVMRHA